MTNLDKTFKIYKKLKHDLNDIYGDIDFHIIKNLGKSCISINATNNRRIIIDYSNSFASTLLVGRYGLGIYTDEQKGEQDTYYFKTYNKLLRYLKEEIK